MHAIAIKESELKQLGGRKTGEFDKFILCQFCDNEKIGSLDTYASLILYDGYPKTVQSRGQTDGTKYTYFGEIDYTRFKLFLLSILWRASISNRPLFREVKLGPHEEQIRQMLLHDDPGEQLRYPCLMMTYRHLKDLPGDIVTQPSRSRVNGGHAYKFLIGGMIYIFFVSKHAIPVALTDFAINPKGEVKIIHTSPRLARKALGNMAGLKLG
jgi:hypothetical protein